MCELHHMKICRCLVNSRCNISNLLIQPWSHKQPGGMKTLFIEQSDAHLVGDSVVHMDFWFDVTDDA